MATADDDEKTVTGPTVPGRRARDDDPVSGIDAERRRGRAAAGLQGGHMLPLGTRLRDYEITGLVGEGGFGIVYLAWDHALQRRVAIKEYMPASMATRVAGSSAIVVKSERHLDTFRAGLKSFVNEARLLARFDHASLVKVYRFWEENGTAYMAMPYYEGPTLKTALAALDGAPSEEELRAWLQPLLDALELMHSKHCFHRDIAPDNILLTAGGPLLLDFGAARRVIGDMTHAITVVLKPGYAPIEQYGDVASMAQGAWTDLYALASVVYFAITGSTPTSSVERLMDDRVEPLALVARGRYSDELLRAVDAALAVRPADRPQSVAAFRTLLGLPATPVQTVGDSGWASGWSTAPAPLASPERTEPLARAADGGVEQTPALERAGAAVAAPSPSVSAPGRRRIVAIALAGGAVVVVLAVFGWLQPTILERPTAMPQPSAAAASATTTTEPTRIAETPAAASAAAPAPIVDARPATPP
ncbi:MAG TPA: serine/threonine-protein kinase, partial [Caldimonas sp.]|nr:serine/threonine-protein kinase [Caldimonas sp.]